MIIEVPGPELSIPTPTQYQVERIVAPKRTRTFPDDAKEADIEAWVRSVEAWQDAWILRRENEVRASFGMKPRATPAKVDAAGKPGITSETLKDLRDIGVRLHTLTGEPVMAQVPTDEAAAQVLLAQLRAEVDRLTKAPEASKAAICSNARAHRTPAGLNAAVAEYSMKHFRRLLCIPCQDAERRRAQ